MIQNDVYSSQFKLTSSLYNYSKMYSYSNSRSSYGTSTEIKPKDKDQPLDTVSFIAWDSYKDDPSFITSSWDGYLRYYMLKRQTTGNQLELVWKMFLNHPVLCCDINQNNIAFAGLATGDVLAISLQNSSVVVLGSHQAPICGIFWLREKRFLITLGFDNLLKIWSLQSNNNFCQLQQKLPMKTITCCYDFPFLIIGSNESTVAVISLKNMPNNVNFPQSPNDYQKSTVDKFSRFNCSNVNAHAKKIIIGTIDGRVLHYNIKDQYSGPKISDLFISKSQKKNDTRAGLYGQIDTVCIGSIQYDSFVFIGGSEQLTVFNIFKKMKSKTFVPNSTSTGATTFVKLSPKSDYLVYATGTDWLKGLHELQNLKKPKLYMVKLEERELKQYVSR